MKVGDIVKIKKNLRVYKFYGGEFFVDSMKRYRGKQAKITRINGGCYSLDIDNGENAWTDAMLEPVSKKYEVIVAGNTVIVKDYKGNKGIAKCSPEDEFNLSTGISLAISRLGKPSSGEIYYSICLSSKNPVVWHHWADDSTDNTLYERGLVFKTIEEAEEAVKIMLDSISLR